jgi:CRP-like cAMP-binding protein
MGTGHDHAAWLGKAPLFSSCVTSELELLARHATVAAYLAGTPLVKEGEEGSEFFVLIEGEAVVTVGGREVDRIGPGDHFGELALIDPAPRDASVTAVSDVQTLILERRGFRVAVRQVPAIADQVMAGLARRLRAADLTRIQSHGQ